MKVHASKLPIRTAALALALALLPVAGFADNGSLGPTVTGETGLFSLLSGETLPQGEWSWGLYYNNWDRVAIEQSPSPRIAPGKNRDYDWNRLSTSIGYGITDNFELSLMLPYDALNDNGKLNGPVRINDTFFTRKIDGSGLANARLGAKWNLFTAEDKQSHFGLNAFIEAPTGKEHEGVSTGATGFGLGLAYDYKHWALNLGYRDPGDPDKIDSAREILAGIGYAARINDKFSWITELSGTFYTGGDAKPPKDDIDLTTGGRIWLGADENWAFNFGLRGNVAYLGDTDKFCPLGGLVGVTYFPHLLREKREAARLAAEEEARRKAAEEEAQRKAAEEEARRKAAEEEARRKAAEEEARRKAAEEEARRQQAPPPPPPPPAIEEVCQFASGSARVDNRCKATLDEVALRMKQEGQRIALVIGYTDSPGSEAANLRISQRRADAVKAYLVSRHGIDAERITTEGRGEADPVGDNATKAGRAQNRRAVIILKVR
ncbi:MAG: OmpA family protein [Thermoanaerobaculia bacterium]